MALLSLGVPGCCLLRLVQEARLERSEESVGRAGHDPPVGVCQAEIFSPFVAGIIGAGRSWTAWMVSVLSIPRK